MLRFDARTHFAFALLKVQWQIIFIVQILKLFIVITSKAINCSTNGWFYVDNRLCIWNTCGPKLRLSGYSEQVWNTNQR